MKINKSTLKKLIREAIEEGKEDHIMGISKKIERLRGAVEAARKFIDDEESRAQDDYDLMDIRSSNYYFDKQTEISNLEDKITLLLKQLNQLKQDEPGQLERPME